MQDRKVVNTSLTGRLRRQNLHSELKYAKKFILTPVSLKTLEIKTLCFDLSWLTLN